MRKSRSIAMIAGLCLFVVLIGGCSNQPSVGLVDMEKVIQESPKVKLLQEKLSAKEKEVTEKIPKEQSGKTEEVEKQQQVLADEYRQMQKQVTDEFESDLKKTIDQIAQEKKLSVTLYKKGVVQGGIDVTEEVLKRLQ